MSYGDPSMMRVASWLPAAAQFSRAQVAVFRDQDELDHGALAHLTQLVRVRAGTPPRRIKQIKVRGVNNEISRAISAIEYFIQDLVAAIAQLYDPRCSDAAQDPELSRVQMLLGYLRTKAYKISALRKKYAEIRNSGKRNTLHTISNIFSAIIQRGARQHAVHDARHPHCKQIADA